MKINVDEVRTQLSSENTQISTAMSSTYEMAPALDEYMGNSMLQGETYDSFCDMFNSVTKPLIKAILCMLEAKYEGNAMYSRALEQNLAGMGKVNDSVLRNVVEVTEKKITDLRSNSFVETIASPCIGVLEKLISSSQEKLDKIDAFIAQTNGCYDEFDTRNSLVLQAINCARNISFNTTSGQISGMNATGYDWAREVNDYYTLKTHEAIKEQYGDYYKDNRDDFYKIKQVVDYERFNKGDIDKVNKFLGGLETKDIIGIKAVAYAADPAYRKLWLKYLDKYKVEVDKESGAYYTNKADKIVVNPEKYRGEKYHTFFHECGHAIDYYASVENGGKKYFSETYIGEDGQTLDQAIVGDVKAFIGAQVATSIAGGGYNMSASESNEVTENIINNIMSGGETQLTATEEKIADEVKMTFSKNAYGRRNSLASDVYSGVTDYELLGSYSHENSADSAGTYWLYNDGTRRRNPSTEYVADYFGYAMTNNAGGMQSVETYLGDSKEVMESMIGAMGNK